MKAEQLERFIMQQAQKGLVKEQIDENKLISLLESLNSQTTNVNNKIIYKRKNYDSDDDLDNLDNLDDL